VIGGALLAVAGAAGAQETGQIPSPAPGRSYQFDAASVKPSATDDRLRVFDFQRSGSLVARNQTLRLLIAMAYGTPFPVPLPDERIVGGPVWMSTARFAVDARTARPPDPASAERDIGFMLRSLLAERFALVARIEPRSQLVYALIRAPATKSRTSTLRVSSGTDCTKERCGLGGGPGRFELRGVSLDLLAWSLSEVVGRPVVNQTRLEGLFDGSLEWAPSPEETAAVVGGAPLPADAQAGVSIFTAIQEQLGLQLRDTRAPIETVIVTRAELPVPD
jgi:uncharacterized protein (TIGR03435 family)